jgi:hypothetical protein
LANIPPSALKLKIRESVAEKLIKICWQNETVGS